MTQEFAGKWLTRLVTGFQADECFDDLAGERVGLADDPGFSDGGIKTITLRASGTRAPKLMNTMLRLATVELLKPNLDSPVNVIILEVDVDKGLTTELFCGPNNSFL